MGVNIYNRSTKSLYEEKQFKGGQLKFLYNTILGRIILKLFIAGKWYSKHNAKNNDSRKSINKIRPFIDKYGIDITEYEKREYNSFNDFFIRKIIPDKRPIPREENVLPSVADSKLTYYKIEKDLSIKIKNSIYTVEELLKDKQLADEYRNGTCMVFRLTVDDYHHYCYCDDGNLLYSKYIDGRLHTVGAISAKRHKVYCENCREYSVLATKHFGKVIQMEIGALLVGKIVNNRKTCFRKGDEKGWFEMGGSAIVLLFTENIVNVDEDIVVNSAKGIETKVKYCERVGERA